jgi:hypothetical protein
MYAKRICGWSRGCISSPSGHKNRKLISLFFNEIGNYVDVINENLFDLWFRDYVYPDGTPFGHIEENNND